MPALNAPSSSWVFTVSHGLPSLTKTGMATRLGETNWTISMPFSARALFILYLWFWNQIFTWVGVSRRALARCSLSGAERYLCWRNLRSSSYVWALEKSTLLFLFFTVSLLSPVGSLSISWDSSVDNSGDFDSFRESIDTPWITIKEETKIRLVWKIGL